MHWVVKVARDSALELVIFNALGAGIAVIALLLIGGGLFPDFGFVILLEAVVLMLVGGALDLSTSGSMRMAMRQLGVLFRRGRLGDVEEPTPEERKKVGATAATYALTGILLFVEAGMLTLAYV